LRKIAPQPKLPLAMESCRHFRAFIASTLLCAFLLALVLAAAPQIHERFHADAGSPGHECAVTLIATGKCEQGSAPLIFVAPQPAELCEQVAVLHPIALSAPCLSAAIFEHAPPASA
jgi:hypothetical protein